MHLQGRPAPPLTRLFSFVKDASGLTALSPQDASDKMTSGYPPLWAESVFGGLDTSTERNLGERGVFPVHMLNPLAPNVLGGVCALLTYQTNLLKTNPICI